MATISVIIPTYKPGIYFEKCLNSIACQDNSDFELIIVLNGCKEPYYSDIEKLLTKFELISKSKLIQTDQAGVSNARNIGIDNAKGEYIAFIDDDDFISPTYLSGLLRGATNDTVTISNVARIEDDKVIPDYSITQSYLDLKDQGFKNLYQSRRVLNSPWMKLYSRQIIGKNRFNTEISLGEDALFNFKLSCNIRYLIASDTNTIYYYNNREGSSWTNVSKKKLFNNFITLFHQYTKIYFSAPFKYNFFFYISRLIAITINFLLPILVSVQKRRVGAKRYFD